MRRALIPVVAVAVMTSLAGQAAAAGPVRETTRAVTTTTAALQALDACGTTFCTRRALTRAGTLAGTGFDTINGKRARNEARCDAAWSTGVQWGLLAIRDAARVADESAVGAPSRRARQLLSAGRARLAKAAAFRLACRNGEILPPAGRFAACLRQAAGGKCILSQYAKVTAADRQSGKPQLVTRLTCAGRAFRGHWELRVEGRPLSKSSPFLACLSRTHEDFAVALDLAYMGFAADTRLPTREFKATLRIVDDDLRRAEGETRYRVYFAPPAGGVYDAGVPAAWVIESIAR